MQLRNVPQGLTGIQKYAIMWMIELDLDSLYEQRRERR